MHRALKNNNNNNIIMKEPKYIVYNARKLTGAMYDQFSHRYFFYFKQQCILRYMHIIYS